MARDFEDHCWKDIVDEEILEIYAPYRREVRVGRKPAVLAIDLYNKAYQGGNRPVREVNRLHEGSCGENAWKAIEPITVTVKGTAPETAQGIYVNYLNVLQSSRQKIQSLPHCLRMHLNGKSPTRTLVSNRWSLAEF
jgi:hypothetical protein